MKNISELEMAKKVVKKWEEENMSPQEALEEIKKIYGVE